MTEHEADVRQDKARTPIILTYVPTKLETDRPQVASVMHAACTADVQHLHETG